MEYSSEELFIHFPTTVSPCCFFIPREIRDVVSNQDIRVLKILSIPAGDWKLLVDFICLYVESSSEKFLFCSLMRWRDMEGGVFGGSSMFKKLDQNSVSVKKKNLFDQGSRHIRHRHLDTRNPWTIVLIIIKNNPPPNKTPHGKTYY